MSTLSRSEAGGPSRAGETPARAVHLELHTPDAHRASVFYATLMRWQTEEIEVRSSRYRALELGDTLDGGIVESAAPQAIWLPYAEVASVVAVTDRARGLGARVLLEPREGPAGWRSVLTSPAGGPIALWQPKPRFGRRS